jgi:hypothetical protein
MQQTLRPFAIACKVVAIIEYLGGAWVKINLDVSGLRATSQPMYRDAPQDWGTAAYYHRTYSEIVVICLLLLLALIPNRWLVSSRFVFWVSMLIALTPILVVVANSFSIHDLSSWLDAFIALVLMSLFFGFLPLSLIFSFWRHRRGEKVTYA